MEARDGWNHVYRRIGERYSSCILIQCQFWMWRYNTLRLLEIMGLMIDDLYIISILQKIMFFSYIGCDRFVLMHDNARPQAASIVTNFLHAVQIQTLGWTLYSLDFNTIEHMWDQLKKSRSKYKRITSDCSIKIMKCK